MGVREIVDKSVDFIVLATEIRRVLKERPVVQDDHEELNYAKAESD